jgi:F-type H+-transporting ATPase subunit delta
MSRYARPYAQAFLEAAPPGYDVGGFIERASTVARAVAGDRRLKSFLATPAIPLDAKRGVIEELAQRQGMDDYGQRLLRIVLEHRRIPVLEEILAAIREARDRQLGIVEAEVRVAAPLADGDGDRIAQALARQLGRRVRMKIRVDASILAGFVARVGSEVFDASAVRAIERFRDEAVNAG